jgi:precorrin isomerase
MGHRCRHSVGSSSQWRLSITEEDCRDLMRRDAWARNAQMIGQDENRALGIEKADNVVVIGDAAAAVRDVTQTIATKCEQLFAFSVSFIQVRKDIRDPAEAMAN